MSHSIYNNELNQQVNKLELSIFENKTSPKVAAENQLTWNQFCANIEQPIISDTKDVELFSPCKFNNNQTRTNNNVVKISMLVFDIDYPQGRSPSRIIELVSGFDALLHSTWSHTDQNPRYRLILPLSKPVLAQNFNAVREGFLFFNSELASIIDRSCSDLARAYYLFSYPNVRSGYAVFITNQGKPVDPDRCVVPIDKSLTTQQIANVIQGGRNTALTKFVGKLIHEGNTFDQSLRKSIVWNRFITPPMDESEVIRTHENIWKTHNRNHPESDQNDSSPERFTAKEKFTLISASDLLETIPRPREWLLSEFLPKKIVASVIAAGGTGKSFLAMHLAVTLAAGSSLFSKFIASTPSKVVFISGEDDKIELQRRLHAVTQGMPPNLIQTIKSNIQFIDLSDSFELFTYKPPSGEVNMTSVPVDLVKAVKEKIGDEVGLVILDPVSRFRGGEENSAADTTRFVQALQYIRDQLNTTVLALHHVNKGAKTNGSGQNNARGSSAFIDGVRLVYELNALSEEEVKKQYGSPTVTPRVMTLSCVKSNYGKPIDSLTLCKRLDGSLELFTMQAGQHQKLTILQEIKISQLSKTKFKETYGDANGKFGLSEKALLQKLMEYEKEKLITIPSRGTMLLTDAGETLLKP